MCIRDRSEDLGSSTSSTESPSSEYSDWIADHGVNLEPPKRRSRRKRKPKTQSAAAPTKPPPSKKQQLQVSTINCYDLAKNVSFTNYCSQF